MSFIVSVGSSAVNHTLVDLLIVEMLFFLLIIRLSFVLSFNVLTMPYPCVEHQVLTFLGAH